MKSKTKSEGRGNRERRGFRKRVPLQDPVPRSPRLSSPKSTPLSSAPKCWPLCTLSSEGTGPTRPDSGPNTVQSTPPTPDSPPAATPTPAALNVGKVPPPTEDRVGEDTPSLQALGTGALALRGPCADELKYYSGAGARRSGGSRALSKRDKAGLIKAPPTLSCFAAPIPKGLCSVLNSAPPYERCSGPPRSGHP